MIKKKDKLTKNERREKIKKLITSTGLWNINKTTLSKHFGVSRNTIYKDIQYIKENHSLDLKECVLELDSAFRNAIKNIRRINESSVSESSKIQSANSLSRLINSYTGFLESWDLKSITPLRVEGLSVSVDFETWLDDLKKKRGVKE